LDLIRFAMMTGFERYKKTRRVVFLKEMERVVAFDFYIADMRVNHGNSDGPVYDARTGKVRSKTRTCFHVAIRAEIEYFP